MRIKIFLKKLVSIGVAAIFAVTLVGCFDLGEFKDEAAYYEAFGEIGLVYGTRETNEGGETVRTVVRNDYSVKDYFYNKNTGENFSYGDPKDSEADEGKDIGQLPYSYMVIPVNQAMKMDSFALYFNALTTCSLDIFFYVVNDLPDDGNFTNIKLLGDPEYQQKLDEDNNPMTDAEGKPIYSEEKVEYSDPDDSLIIGKATANLKEGKWISLVMDTWNGGRFVEINAGQYILLRFINNCGVYEGKAPLTKFRVTNLLIRAVS